MFFSILGFTQILTADVRVEVIVVIVVVVVAVVVCSL